MVIDNLETFSNVMSFSSYALKVGSYFWLLILLNTIYYNVHPSLCFYLLVIVKYYYIF